MDINELPSNIVHKHGMMGRLHNDQKETKWIPLFLPLSEGCCIGIDSGGRWVGNSASGLIEFVSNDWYAPLLPTLECKLSDFVKELESKLSTKELPTEIANSFPFYGVVKCGLRRSSYWVERALMWLDSLPVNEEIVSLLKNASEDKGRVEQRVRQHAKRLLKKAVNK